MAFLDNSGDIILDAVLTDLGRKRMSQGNFKITKYAFGDDEVDYSLYNYSHASGAAYYDLEIMQTPIFEAFASSDAGINYGLSSYSSTDMLYLPTMKMNETTNDQAVQMTGSIVYLAANTETATALKASTALGDSKYFLQSGETDGYSVILETGLDTTDLAATQANRSSYLVSNNLVDSTFTISFDNRFISSVATPTAGSRFTNNSRGDDKVKMTLSAARSVSSKTGKSNTSTAIAKGVSNTVYKTAGAAVSDTAVSDFSGPRASATSLNFSVISGLDTATGGTLSSKFASYGKTSVDTFGDGNTYATITTTITVTGDTTGVTTELPVTIIARQT